MRRAWWPLGVMFALVVVLWFVRTTLIPDEAASPDDAPALASAAPESATRDAMTLENPAASRESAEHGADEIELCGGLWVKTRADGNIDDDDFKRVLRLPEERARMLEALRAESSEFARAAAIRLALIGSEPPPLPEGATTCEPAQCEVQRRYATRFAEARDALAQMATTTRDPQVYALAFNNCQVSQPSEGACQLVSAEQWARLDPGNATPWLFVLQQAGQQRDAATQNEALHRIATSTRSDQFFFRLSRLVIDHVPDDDASALVALTLASEVFGIEVAYALPGYQTLLEQCRGSALRDANRRQTCNAVAEFLVERGDTLLERNIGVRLGAQVGWPAERVERLRGESVAYQASRESANNFNPTSTCADIRRDLEYVRLNARRGEAGALREWVAESDIKPEAFIRAERDEQARRAAEAASAAAAASAASAPR
ncbi:MAG: hypothetical protein ABI887_15200 [Burkholderiales bacterium]